MYTSSYVGSANLLVCSLVRLRKILFLLLIISVISPELLSDSNVSVQAQRDDIPKDGIIPWWSWNSNSKRPTGKPELVTNNTTGSVTSSNRTSTTESSTGWQDYWYSHANNFPSSILAPIIPIAVIVIVMLVIASLRIKQRFREKRHPANGGVNDADIENAQDYSYTRSYATPNVRNAPPTYTDTCMQNLLRDEGTTPDQSLLSSDQLNNTTTSDNCLPSYDDVISGRRSK